MSMVIRVYGKTVGLAKNGLQKHIVRHDEQTAISASYSSDSYINPKNTHLNRVLLSPDHNVMKDIRDDFKEMNKRRKAKGLRAKQCNKNMFITGTVAFSDDSLKELGCDFSLVDEKGKVDFSKQSDIYKNRVYNILTNQYNALVERKQIDAGKVICASIHVDESKPHLDFITNNIDLDALESHTRYILNGVEGTGRGEKLSAFQDQMEACSVSAFGREAVNKYRLFRGEKKREKKQKLSNLYEREQATEKKEKETIETFDNVIAMQKNNEAREYELAEKENKVEQKSIYLEQKEKELDESSNEFGEYKIEQQEKIKENQSNINNRLYNLEKFEKQKMEWERDWEKKYLERFARDSKNNLTAEDAERRLDAIENVEQARAISPQKQQGDFVGGRDSFQQMG